LCNHHHLPTPTISRYGSSVSLSELFNNNNNNNNNNIEILTSQLWLGNIHLSWDVAISRIRLGRLTCSLKSFLQLNMCQELQIFAVVYMYWGAS
jgi:hypothetical protein